jgi:hypothetical protein
MTTARIDDTIAEVLDAIGDDDAYTHARTALVDALTALRGGTTAEADAHLSEALRMIEEACPEHPTGEEEDWPMLPACSCWHVMPPNRWLSLLSGIVEACAVCGWILTYPRRTERW